MDLIKNVNLIGLYDLYGGLLTDKQKQIFEFYVKKDLSLKEVSDILNITRQAVKFTLDSIEKALNHYEEVLCIKNKFDYIKQTLNEIKDCSNNEKITAKIDNILEEL